MVGRNTLKTRALGTVNPAAIDSTVTRAGIIMANNGRARARRELSTSGIP
jgi:hypothetical protein